MLMFNEHEICSYDESRDPGFLHASEIWVGTTSSPQIVHDWLFVNFMH